MISGESHVRDRKVERLGWLLDGRHLDHRVVRGATDKILVGIRAGDAGTAPAIKTRVVVVLTCGAASTGAVGLDGRRREDYGAAPVVVSRTGVAVGIVGLGFAQWEEPSPHLAPGGEVGFVETVDHGVDEALEDDAGLQQRVSMAAIQQGGENGRSARTSSTVPKANGAACFVVAW